MTGSVRAVKNASGSRSDRRRQRHVRFALDVVRARGHDDVAKARARVRRETRQELLTGDRDRLTHTGQRRLGVVPRPLLEGALVGALYDVVGVANARDGDLADRIAGIDLAALAPRQIGDAFAERLGGTVARQR